MNKTARRIYKESREFFGWILSAKTMWESAKESAEIAKAYGPLFNEEDGLTEIEKTGEDPIIERIIS